MSCHSTPANVAVLGYCGHSFGLPASAVESEFHWLKKMGKDRAMPVPEPGEWSEFLMQRERWVRHDATLSPARRARMLERLSAAFDQVPDGPSFYALTNLPVRLAQVTEPSYVEGAADRVIARVDSIAENPGKGQPRLDAAAATLQQAALALKCDPPERVAGDPQSVRELALYIRGANLSERSKADLYSAQQMLAHSLKLLRKRSA